MYLLDTNVVSELRRPRPHGAVLAWLQSVDDAQLFLSAVTLGEIQAGIELTREQRRYSSKSAGSRMACGHSLAAFIKPMAEPMPNGRAA